MSNVEYTHGALWSGEAKFKAALFFLVCLRMAVIALAKFLTRKDWSSM
jgi:hypothetical protein